MNRILKTLLLLGITAAFPTTSGQAYHLVEEHQHVCDSDFPCPPEMARRIDFWIEVFHKFSTRELIFHDNLQPERVYSVIESNESCSRRKEPRVVKNERKRLREKLEKIADGLEQGATLWDDEEKHFLQLFPSSSASEIREAALMIRCQQGNRDRFLEGLKRYGAFRDFVVGVLKEKKLPTDIQYLPFVESAYDPAAYSRVGAAGLWQIMAPTARKLGLKVSDTVDQRFDPYFATPAAALYLQDAFNEFDALAQLLVPGDKKVSIGPFAITSYNYGTAGMRKAMTEVQADFVKLLTDYTGHRFRTAVRNFYASFLAARYVAKYSEAYFGKVAFEKPLEFKLVSLPVPASVFRISDHFGIDLEDLKTLNPSLTKRVWKGRRLVPQGFELRLPKRSTSWDKLVAALPDLPPEQLQVTSETYRVRRGDTPCGIARSFDIRCADLLETNDLHPRSRIRVGQILMIPGKGPIVVASASKKKPTPTPTPAVVAAASPIPTATSTPLAEEPATEKAHEASAAEVGSSFGVDEELLVTKKVTGKKTIYTTRVEVEETLAHFADWLGLPKEGPLVTLNRLKSRAVRVGQTLRLPIRSEDERKQFEQKRIDYHHTLEDEFKQNFDIVGQDVHIIRKGDTPFTISREQEVPLWLLKRFNPQVFERPLKPGESVDIPALVEREKPENGSATPRYFWETMF